MYQKNCIKIEQSDFISVLSGYYSPSTWHVLSKCLSLSSFVQLSCHLCRLSLKHRHRQHKEYTEHIICKGERETIARTAGCVIVRNIDAVEWNSSRVSVQRCRKIYIWEKQLYRKLHLHVVYSLLHIDQTEALWAPQHYTKKEGRKKLWTSGCGWVLSLQSERVAMKCS